MKNRMISVAILSSFTALSAMDVSPLSVESRSTDTGGVKTAIEAYSDGGGVLVINQAADSKIDNSAMNTLVFKYGGEAKNNSATLTDQVKTISSTSTSEEKILADKINITGVSFAAIPNGTACDDKDSGSFQDAFVDGKCIGTYKNSCLELKQANSLLPTGIYTIDNTQPYKTYCDMTTDGGGWTLIASVGNRSYFKLLANSPGGVTLDEENQAKAAYVSAPLAVNTINDINSKDIILPSYTKTPFTEFMFKDDGVGFITYSLTSSSMKDYYSSIYATYTPLTYRLQPARTNISTAVNNCGTLEIAMDSGDNDGGVINYEAKRAGEFSGISYGPAWDAGSNGGCHYDDERGHIYYKQLGGSLAPVSTKLFWMVR